MKKDYVEPNKSIVVVASGLPPSDRNRMLKYSLITPSTYNYLKIKRNKLQFILCDLVEMANYAK